jgi:hypothetical protein
MRWLISAIFAWSWSVSARMNLEAILQQYSSVEESLSSTSFPVRPTSYLLHVSQVSEEQRVNT